MTRTLLRDRPLTPLGESLPRLESLVSQYTGVVRRVHTILASPDDARLIRVGATTSDTRQVIDADLGRRDGDGGGCAERMSEARAAAIGEAAERYAGSFLAERALVLATADELGPAAIDPPRFALFARRQHDTPGFGFAPFRRDTRVRWARGFALPDGEETYVPAQLVYLTWSRLAPEEQPVAYSTSNGLACGPTLEEAVLAGLLELVERDAFMITWAAGLSLPLLDWSSEPELLAFESRYLAAAGGRHAVVDLSDFLHVPTALAVVRGDGSREPAVAVGAGSAPSIVDAVKKALAEAYSVRSWGRGLVAATPHRTFAEDCSDVVSFADHIHLYALPGHAGAADFLTASTVVRKVEDVAVLPGVSALERICQLTGRLRAQGVRAYAVDVTSPDVADAGLVVAKVVAPELCPLDVRHDTRFLGGSRLYRAAHELGLRDAPLAAGDVNADPHPFP